MTTEIRQRNVVEAIQAECNRVREIVKLYDELPNGVGRLGSTWMRQLIEQGERAIADQDAVACVRCLVQLRGVTA